MEILGYQFKPTLLSIIVCFVMVAILSSLGFWQLQRADYKRSLLQEMSQQETQSEVDLNSMIATNVELLDESLRYRKLEVNGRFLERGVVYTDNEMHERQAGFHVYVPFEVSGTEKMILVNLGWLPYAGSRETLPDFSLSGSEQVIRGFARIPSKRPVLESSTDPLSLDDTNLWLYMDLDKYRNEFDRDILPIALFATETSDAETATFVREWPKFNPKTGMHIGYAIQWFGLALITFCIFLYTSLKKKGIAA